MTPANFKNTLYLTLSTFIFIAGVFIFQTQSVKADEVADEATCTGQSNSMSGGFTSLNDAFTDDDGFLNVKLERSDTQEDMRLAVFGYTVDGDCTLSSGGEQFIDDSSLFDWDPGENYGVKFLDATHYQYWNFTDDSAIGSAVDIGGLGWIYVRLYADRHELSPYGITSAFAITEGVGAVPLRFNSIQNQTSHDFSDWWLCVNIPADDTETYTLEVIYSLETDDFENSDTSGTIPVSAGQNTSECPLLSKTVDLDPGFYKAIARLYYGDVDADNLFYSTLEFDFTIVEGEKVVTLASIPPTQEDNQAQAQQECEQNWSNALSRTICKLGVFLLVPDSASLNTFKTLPDVMKTKMPFSYVYDMKELFEAVSTADASVGEDLTATWLGGSTVTLFSPSSLNTWAGSGTITILHGIGVMVIWLGVAFAMWGQTKGLFN